MNDEQLEDYINDYPDEMFEGQPVKMNFSELFKLTFAREICPKISYSIAVLRYRYQSPSLSPGQRILNGRPAGILQCHL